MFSDFIKKEISKLLLVTFLYSNLSPAFCIPEYVINVERRQNDLGQMVLAIRAQQLVQSTLVAGALVYKTVVEQVVFPFMQMTTARVATTAKLYEILQNVQASVSADKTPPKTSRLSYPVIFV